jgi:hypothetical protein
MNTRGAFPAFHTTHKVSDGRMVGFPGAIRLCAEKSDGERWV